MRVVIVITDSHPELLTDLMARPIKGRAERLRTLATLGLATIQGHFVARPPSSVSQGEERGRGLANATVALVRQQLKASLG